MKIKNISTTVVRVCGMSVAPERVFSLSKVHWQGWLMHSHNQRLADTALEVVDFAEDDTPEIKGPAEMPGSAASMDDGRQPVPPAPDPVAAGMSDDGKRKQTLRDVMRKIGLKKKPTLGKVRKAAGMTDVTEAERDSVWQELSD